jgi:hypothetical protein
LSLSLSLQDKLTEKYSSSAIGGDDNVNMFQMLIQHPFNTEPNDSVVLADQNKQVQMRSKRQATAGRMGFKRMATLSGPGAAAGPRATYVH